jgi:hypothetical protein
MRGGRALVLLLALGFAQAWASGPRWVTGPPFFTGTAGVPVAWAKGSVAYVTDPGDLSASVNHQAADALVAAAAGVWNLPVANLTLAQGGMLAEHVSGANAYLATEGLVFPADVASARIAVIYDTDGSVTELLLGGGASAPSSCRQNAVTGNVDGFDPAGYIVHAELIVNGRCTGTAAAAQMQLQYQLERAFGRVLGLAGSQANDNVFTGTPVPTYNQALHWPIMHPLEILCGPYAYQCLPEPFQLRPDDVASMVLLYGIGPNDTVPAGKQVSLAAATAQWGTVAFPTGEGMAGVNVLVARMPGYTNVEEPWVTVSAVSGAGFRRMGATPLTVAGTDAGSSNGTLDANQQGAYNIPYVPMPDGAALDNHVVTAEAVNPLYIGSYSLGPYAPGAVTPSGTPAMPVVRYFYVGNVPQVNFTDTNAASQCGTGLDGMESLPAQVDASGWWQGLLCGYGHAAWGGVDVKPNRTLTLDVTALDELGNATLAKAMPTMGAWAASDPTGTLPTLGVTASAFNAASVGTTRMQVATGSANRLRLAIVDERGEGRPDFAFQARVLYADTVFPAVVPEAGGTVTVTGMGFRAGNAVAVNGVNATVLSWSATSMVVRVPAMSVAGASAGTAVDVTVRDLSTGAVSVESGALTYSGAAVLPQSMRLVSAPSGTIFAGDSAATPFAVQVLAGDGVTPVAGETVTFSASAGSVVFAACGAATCTVTTDANGTASSGVTPVAAGQVNVQAVDGGMSQTASFVALVPVGSVQVINAPAASVQMGLPYTFQVQVLQPDGTPAVGVPVTFAASPAGSVLFAACGASTCTLTTNGGGYASSGVNPVLAAAITLTATADKASATAIFTAIPEVDVIQVLGDPSGNAVVGQPTSTGFVIQLTGSDGVTPLFGRSVTFSGPPGVIFTGCNASPCTLVTNWGTLGTGVIAKSPGTFTVQVAEVSSAGVSSDVRTATFTATVPGMQMKVIGVPADGSPIYATTSGAFTVQVLNGDGSPSMGTAVLMGPMAAGTALMTICLPCLVYTDSNGMASSTLIPLTGGPIALQAFSTPLMQTATFTAAGSPGIATAMQAPQYVAENAIVTWMLEAVFQQNGLPGAGQPVVWTGSTGLLTYQWQTVTDSAGLSETYGQAGPLLGGQTATATACAWWNSVCASFQATGVSAADLRLTVVSGGGQVVSGGANLQPVVFEVVDTAGHPVAGAAVTVYQTASEAVVCPARGRCPVAPVMASGTKSAVSDIGGLVSVTPLVWAGGAEVTQVAASVGTQGFVTTDLGYAP